jgi:hypothetical protein
MGEALLAELGEGLERGVLIGELERDRPLGLGDVAHDALADPQAHSVDGLDREADVGDHVELVGAALATLSQIEAGDLGGEPAGCTR